MPKQLKWWPYMDAPPLVFLNFNNGTHTCTCHWQTDGLLAFPNGILKTLEEGAGSVIHIESNSVATANNQKLVHLTAEVTTNETLEDPIFKVLLS